jgi:cardiolipin synthase
MVMDGRSAPKLASASRVLLGLSLLGTHAAARAGDRESCALPPNAFQPPGASFEGYPAVGREQEIAIGREILRGTLSATARAPVRSTALAVSRLTERLGVRAAEELGPPFMRLHALTCGELDSPVAPCYVDLGGGNGGPPTAAHLTLLPGSEQAIQVLLHLIATARVRIDLMMYGWDDDPTGRAVAAALAERARAGVRVRLLVDRTAFLLHNAAAARGDCTFLEALRATPNISVIQPLGTHIRFDHRKLALIDERVAWTGGMILTEVARRRWHNFAFLAEGPIVAQFAAVFAERWQEQGGCPEAPLETPMRSVLPNATARLVQTNIDERSLKRAVYHAVDHARTSVYLENPYFSDEILIEKLVAARARGVDVRAVLTLRGNIKAMNHFETITANRLLRGGCRVWLFPAMTHVKAMSADGVWAYIGTGNFDELSLRNNREVGLSVTSPSLVPVLDSVLFLADMAASQELCCPLPPPPDRIKLEALALWY